jgi:hypothetical protein
MSGPDAALLTLSQARSCPEAGGLGRFTAATFGRWCWMGLALLNASARGRALRSTARLEPEPSGLRVRLAGAIQNG